MVAELAARTLGECREICIATCEYMCHLCHLCHHFPTRRVPLTGDIGDIGDIGGLGFTWNVEIVGAPEDAPRWPERLFFRSFFVSNIM